MSNTLLYTFGLLRKKFAYCFSTGAGATFFFFFFDFPDGFEFFFAAAFAGLPFEDVFFALPFLLPFAGGASPRAWRQASRRKRRIFAATSSNTSASV